MTLNEILEQARKLSPQELEELLQRLQAMQAEPPVNRPKTGAEIVAMLEAMDEPIELVASHIEDPVEWVKQIRHDQRQRRLGDWGQDE
jgi:hypothetical protein